MKFRAVFSIASMMLVIVVIVALIAGSSKVTPYNSHSMHDVSSYHKEGFNTLTYTEINNPSAPAEKSNDKSLGYSSALEGSEPQQSPSKVEGFQGLQSAPFADEKVIDIYSQVKGSSECPANPYSNSKGYLCMTPTDTSLLMTRGGNQTGSFDFQMGP